MLRSVYFNIFPYFSPSLDAKNNIRFYKKENCTMYLFWEICILNANNVLIILQHCCVKITKWKMQYAYPYLSLALLESPSCLKAFEGV